MHFAGLCRLHNIVSDDKYAVDLVSAALVVPKQQSNGQIAVGEFGGREGIWREEKGRRKG